MNIKEVFKQNEDISIKQYLKKCGVADVDKYLKFNTLEKSSEYINIKQSKQLLTNYLTKNIYLLIDTDVDGFMSSSMFKVWCLENYPNVNIELIWHKDNPKAHGLRDVVDCILSKPKGLVVSPDGGVNDWEECKRLKESGFEVLVLDHHLQTEDNPYATIINCQNGNVNKNLSGCGVVWKTLDYIKPKSANHLISYVMLSIISDSMNLTSAENATFVKHGKNKIHPYLKPFIKNFNKNGDVESNKSFSFGCISKMNATIRYGTQEDKENLFYTLTGEKEVTEELLDRMTEIHKIQNADKDKIVNAILKRYKDWDKNYLMVKLKQSNPLSGLISNTLLDKLNLSMVMILSNKNNLISGSVRSKLNSKQLLSNSNLVKYSSGHNSAHGVGYKLENETKLIEYLDSVLSKYKPCKEVLLSCGINDIPTSIFKSIDDFKGVYGQGIPIPLIHIQKFTVNGLNWQVMKNGKTLKLTKGAVEFIMFISSKEKRNTLHIGENINYDLEIIGEVSVNKWLGKIKPQIIIDEIETKEKNLF